MSKAEAIYDKVQALPESAQTAVLHMVESLADDSAGGDDRLRRTGADFSGIAETCGRKPVLLFHAAAGLASRLSTHHRMGWVAVPLLLRELQRQPTTGLALQAITGEQPARNTDTLRAAPTPG